MCDLNCICDDKQFPDQFMLSFESMGISVKSVPDMDKSWGQKLFSPVVWPQKYGVSDQPFVTVLEMVLKTIFPQSKTHKVKI